MKNKIALMVMSLQKIDRQHIQLFFLVLSLAILVLGVGAPADGPGTGK